MQKIIKIYSIFLTFSSTTSTLNSNHNETYGVWEESKHCETGFIVGGALEYFEDSDDYGVTNVQMECEKGTGHHTPYMKGSPKTSDWTL